MRLTRTTCSSTTAPSTATSSACAASSAPPTTNSGRSKRSTAPAIASQMAEEVRPSRTAEIFKNPWRFSHRLSLTTRILAVNLLPLALLGGGIFYLDSYRKQLLLERYKHARIEAQITAE